MGKRPMANAAARGNALHAPPLPGTGRPACLSARWVEIGSSAFEGGREIDVEDRAFAWLGADVQTSVGLLQETMDDGQSQTRAFAGELGGKVGLEDFRQNVRGNAGAVVTHGKQEHGRS